MNVQTQSLTNAPQQVQASLSTSPQRPPRDRARDFGVGYGNSSGYASTRRYLGNQPAPRFRCA